MPYLSMLFPLGILAGIVVGIVQTVRHFRKSDSIKVVQEDERVPGAAERVFTYGLSFVGLMAVLYALAGLIALAFVPIFPAAGSLISHHDAEQRASLYLAALIVGAPVWLGLWRHAQKKLRASPAELNTGERRLYFGAIFGSAAVVALFGLQEAVRAALTLSGNTPHNPLIRDLVVGGAQFGVYAAAWFAAARLGWKERSPSATDWAHDLAVYVIAGFSVIFLFVGLQGILHEAFQEIQGATSKSLFNGTSTAVWRSWAGSLSWLLAGLIVWLTLQRYDFRRGGSRLLRVVYEYAMLIWLVPVTIYAGTDFLYEIVRRLFGYHAPAHSYFVSDTVPLLLAAGLLAYYHWGLVRRESTLGPASADAIAYPRRPLIGAFAAYGLAATAIGAAAILWVGIDWLVSSHDQLSGGAWWRDQVSLGLGLAIVGAALWLPAWSYLQTAVQKRVSERDATERRWLLSGITLASALAATGLTVAALYVALTAFLGAGSSNSLSDGLHFVTAGAIALAIFAYYGVILRAEMRKRGSDPRRGEVRLVALIAPDADAALRQITAELDVRVEVIGRLSGEPEEITVGLIELREQISRLGAAAQATRGLLILSPTGGRLYPYGLRSEVGATEISADRIEDPPSAGTNPGVPLTPVKGGLMTNRKV